MPGVARKILLILKKIEFLKGYRGFPPKMSANLVQPFGQLLLTIYIYERSALFYRFHEVASIKKKFKLDNRVNFSCKICNLLIAHARCSVVY